MLLKLRLMLAADNLTAHEGVSQTQSIFAGIPVDWFVAQFGNQIAHRASDRAFEAWRPVSALEV